MKDISKKISLKVLKLFWNVQVFPICVYSLILPQTFSLQKNNILAITQYFMLILNLLTDILEKFSEKSFTHTTSKYE